MILYFSGTGNSRYAAEAIAMVTGDELVSMNEMIKTKNKASIKSDKPLVFVAPVYAGRIPRVVETYIKETKFEGNQNAYFVATCATTPWVTASYTEKLCAEKGFKSMGFHSVIMPQNYITMYDVASDEENDKALNAATPKIKEIAETIKTGAPLAKEVPGKAMMSKFVNPMMYATMVKAKSFYTTDACEGCGKCVMRCPLNNIEMVNKKPQWGKDCTHCMACIGGCPSKAIEYGKKTATRNRYYNTKTPKV